MDIHHNARTCPRSRELIIQRIQQEGQSASEVADSLGISERTVYKWLARYRVEGSAGLEDRSSRPKRVPRQTRRQDREAIYGLRRRRMVVAEIAARLGLARSTVVRIVQQAGWGRLNSLEPPPPARRYERKHPGQLLHLDIKKLGQDCGSGASHHRGQTSPGSRDRLGVCPCLRGRCLPASLCGNPPGRAQTLGHGLLATHRALVPQTRGFESRPS